MDDIVPKITTPFLLILGDQDDVISNPRAKQFYQEAPTEDKAIIEFKGACHQLIQDKEYASLVINETVAFQNMHLV